MQPFSLICKSCAARLKVTKASAVGQLLACPKCGTMLHVTPPTGWTPPPSQSDSQTSTDNWDESAVSGEGNFEDIEALLSDVLPDSNQKHTSVSKWILNIMDLNLWIYYIKNTLMDLEYLWI